MNVLSHLLPMVAFIIIIPVPTWETDLEMVLLEGALLSHLGVGRMVCIWMGEEEADFAPLEIICLLAISSSILLQLPGSRRAAYRGGMLALKEGGGR